MVVRDVPPNSVVVGVPGRVTFRNGERVTGGDRPEPDRPPRPGGTAIEQLVDRIHALEAEVERLKKEADVPADAPAD